MSKFRLYRFTTKSGRDASMNSDDIANGKIYISHDDGPYVSFFIETGNGKERLCLEIPKDDFLNAVTFGMHRELNTILDEQAS